MPTDDIEIRGLQAADHSQVLALIQPFIQQQKVLPRTLDELQELEEHSFVATDKAAVIGFAMLEIYSPKLAELRSLVVAEEYQSRGVGRRLVEAVVGRAHDHNVLEVMAISSSEPFFLSCGFDFTLPGEKKAFFLRTRDD